MDLNLLNRLIEQAKNPNGFVGAWMLSIMNYAHTGMNKWALRKLAIKDDAIMLDIGCGGGRTLQLLSKMNTYGKVYGIDSSEQAIKNSIKTNKKDVNRGKVNLCQASATDIPFPDHFFDLITAFQTHYFWDDLEQSVRDVYRVTKPSGSFWIIAETYKINYHMKSFKSKEEMERLFRETGFHTVEFYEHTAKGWLAVRGIK